MRFAPTLRQTTTALISAGSLLAPLACSAASEEIQVYQDDMRAPGQAGVDLHNNLVVSGRRAADYPGEQPPGKVYRLTPEFTYGLSDTLELGAYLLSSRDASGRVHGDGGKLRLKYIAPHDALSGGFWGLNLELGRTELRVSPTAWNAQLKGIVGWRGGGWTLAANPNIDWSLSQGGEPVGASLDLKLSRAVANKTQIGLESYNELGYLKHPSLSGLNSRSLFAVLDHDFGWLDLNLGLGRGLTSAADRWTVKFIAGIDF